MAKLRRTARSSSQDDSNMQTSAYVKEGVVTAARGACGQHNEITVLHKLLQNTNHGK